MPYNTATYYIKANGSSIVTQKKDTKYKAYNVGKTNVVIAIITGSYDLKWNNVIGTHRLAPGEAVILNIGKRDLYVGVKVINEGDVNGFVHVCGVNNLFDEKLDSSTDYFSLDVNNLAKTLVTFGAGYIPVVGNVLSTVVDFFWPADATPDPWEQIKDKVMEAIDDKAQETIKAILSAITFKELKDKMKSCAKEVDDPKITKTTAAHYVNIMEDLIGMEKRFIFDSNSGPNYVQTNYVLLPMYATMVNLKLTFYQYGITQQAKVGLDDEHITRLKDYIKTMINGNGGAIEHVNKVYREKIDHQYKHANSETLYDQMATARAYCTLNGLQHVPNWKAVADNPTNTKKPYNRLYVMSTSFGRNNALQARFQIKEPVKYPLFPIEYDGTRADPTEVDVLIVNYKDVPVIGGLRTRYSNGSANFTGYVKPFYQQVETKDIKTFNFAGKNLVKVTAHEDGKITALEFTLDDGTTKSFGTPGGTKREFALDKHRIVGFLMCGGIFTGEKVGANIALAYQLIPEKQV